MFLLSGHCQSFKDIKLQTSEKVWKKPHYFQVLKVITPFVA